MVVRDRVRTEPPHPGTRYTQIAVLEDGIVVEHFVTSAASASLVGNIYLGIVQNVLPSMEAAFVDIGRGRNGVLYAGEVNWDAAGLGGADRKIEQALKPGDYVVVQVSKDPVGHKGARLTTQVSLAGRYLVYVPGASSTGISRKLPDTERQRLKEILREVVPSDAGVIIRTASEGSKRATFVPTSPGCRSAGNRSKPRPPRSSRRRPALRWRSTKNRMCWSRSSATCSTRILPGSSFPATRPGPRSTTT
ncbi:hypothetical protein NIIDMKKI_20920 [Mycobacterium kansasii]|nr:hypothetical protein NIIDMKKI_20920 [Mycobacterium kansasii]